MPANHQKVKLLSLHHTQVYWLAQKKSGKGSDQQVVLYMEQQIPKKLSNQQEKFNFLGQEQRFHDKISTNTLLRQFVFKYEGVIDRDDLDDIWAIYRVAQQSASASDQSPNRSSFSTACEYVSLKDSLFQTVLWRTGSSTGHYQIEHGPFYKTITQDEQGLSHLAWLVRMLCQFLKTLHELGINYGNLRAENILVKFGAGNKKIESIKLINFGHTMTLNASDLLTIAE